MSTILITGAGKGLGRESARRLLLDGHDVWLGVRDTERGHAVADELGGGRVVALDVTDDASVANAAQEVEAAGGLDVLINNAGISGARTPVEQTAASDVAHVYETNVFGVVRVMQAFLPLLRRSRAGVVVNVSSGMGSITVTTDPGRLESSIVALAYPSSKTALNMLTTQWAKACPELRINAADPGYTATDLNGHRGTQTVAEGTDAIVRLATLGPDGPTGGFFDRNGTVGW